MSAANGKTRPADRRPCTTCGASIFFAQRVGRDGLSWRPFNAEPSTTDGLRQVSHVLIGDQAWRRTDLIEHWHVRQEITEDAARALVDDYPHHLLHQHHTDEGTPNR